MREPAIGRAPQGSRGSNTGQVYARLRNRLVTLEIPPGAKLDIAALADRLGIGKTLLRQTLVLLAGEGIVFSVPGAGYFSRTLDFTDLSGDYDLALTVLKLAIEADIAAFSDAGLQQPGHASGHRDLPLETDLTQAYAEFIEMLYERIACMASNRKYRQLIQTFNGKTSVVRQLYLQRPAQIRKIPDDLHELTELLRRHEAKGAIAKLEMHFGSKLDVLRELVDEANGKAAAAGQDWVRSL